MLQHSVKKKCVIREQIHISRKINYIQVLSTSLWEEEDVNVKESSSVSIRTFSSETDSEDIVVHELTMRNKFVALIFKKPNMYLGLPRQYEWLIKYIVQKSVLKTCELCLILIITLFKIKQNGTLDRMCDQFEITRPKMTTFIHQGIEVLAIFFQNVVFLPSPSP